MEKAIKISIQIVARMGTRSTSYNIKDMERALLQIDLTPVRDGIFINAEKVCDNHADAIAARRQIETALKRVHRNVAYKFDFEEVQNA